MHYMTLSFTHKNTDIKIREKLSFSNEEKLRLIQKKILECPTVNEISVLSTCNRVEIITSTQECVNSLDHVFDKIAELSDVSKEELEGRADVYEDNGAIHHLFAVASSLDSLVIGETQIVGQLKDAYKFAYEEGFCGQKLGRAMHHAFRCAAAVRSGTDISKSPISVSSVAVSKAKDIFGNIGGMTAVIVGAGEMSELAAKHLITAGVNVIILNRNIEKAQALAESLGELASADTLAKLGEYINRYRMIFSATGAPHAVITDDMLEDKDFDRHFFDIAVPRDIEVCNTKNVHVYAVDDLEEIVSKNMALREEQAQVAYSIVGRSTMDFFKWLQTLSVDPIIKEIRAMARQIAMQEVGKAVKKGYIAADSHDEVARVVHSVFNAFLHKPTKNLKDVAEQPEADTIVQSIQYFFDINEEESKQIDQYKCEYQMEKDI